MTSTIKKIANFAFFFALVWLVECFIQLRKIVFTPLWHQNPMELFFLHIVSWIGSTQGFYTIYPNISTNLEIICCGLTPHTHTHVLAVLLNRKVFSQWKHNSYGSRCLTLNQRITKLYNTLFKYCYSGIWCRWHKFTVV